MDRFYVGIDPGLTGGIGWVSEFEVGAMDRLGDRSVEEIRQLLAGFRCGGLAIVIEEVHSRPNMGKRSAFTFGYQFGRICTIIEALGYKYHLATPQAWMAAVECMSGGDKKVTLAAAKERFPELYITHSTADALLIAQYSRHYHS